MTPINPDLVRRVASLPLPAMRRAIQFLRCAGLHDMADDLSHARDAWARVAVRHAEAMESAPRTTIASQSQDAAE